MPPATGTSLKPVRRMPAPKTLPKIAACDFTRDLDLSQDELLALLDLTQQVKSNPARFAKRSAAATSACCSKSRRCARGSPSSWPSSSSAATAS